MKYESPAKTLIKIQSSTLDLYKKIIKLSHLEQHNPYNLEYLNALEDVVFDSELLTLGIRNYGLEHTKKKPFKPISKTKIADELNISITKIDDIIQISMPPLLNYRNKKDTEHYELYLYSSLLTAKMKEFVVKNKCIITNKKHAVLIFNIVSTEISKQAIPDTDNRKCNDLINVIKQFLIRDDNFEFMSLYQDTVQMGNENKTVAFVVPFTSYESLGANFVKCTNILFGDNQVKNGKIIINK